MFANPFAVRPNHKWVRSWRVLLSEGTLAVPLPGKTQQMQFTTNDTSVLTTLIHRGGQGTLPDSDTGRSEADRVEYPAAPISAAQIIKGEASDFTAFDRNVFSPPVVPERRLAPPTPSPLPASRGAAMAHSLAAFHARCLTRGVNFEDAYSNLLWEQMAYYERKHDTRVIRVSSERAKILFWDWASTGDAPYAEMGEIASLFLRRVNFQALIGVSDENYFHFLRDLLLRAGVEPNPGPQTTHREGVEDTHSQRATRREVARRATSRATKQAARAAKIQSRAQAPVVKTERRHVAAVTQAKLVRSGDVEENPGMADLPTIQSDGRCRPRMIIGVVDLEKSTQVLDHRMPDGSGRIHRYCRRRECPVELKRENDLVDKKTGVVEESWYHPLATKGMRRAPALLELESAGLISSKTPESESPAAACESPVTTTVTTPVVVNEPVKAAAVTTAATQTAVASTAATQEQLVALGLAPEPVMMVEGPPPPGPFQLVPIPRAKGMLEPEGYCQMRGNVSRLPYPIDGHHWSREGRGRWRQRTGEFRAEPIRPWQKKVSAAMEESTPLRNLGCLRGYGTIEYVKTFLGFILVTCSLALDEHRRPCLKTIRPTKDVRDPSVNLSKLPLAGGRPLEYHDAVGVLSRSLAADYPVLWGLPFGLLLMGMSYEKSLWGLLALPVLYLYGRFKTRWILSLLFPLCFLGPWGSMGILAGFWIMSVRRVSEYRYCPEMLANVVLNCVSCDKTTMLLRIQSDMQRDGTFSVRAVDKVEYIRSTLELLRDADLSFRPVRWSLNGLGSAFETYGYSLHRPRLRRTACCPDAESLSKVVASLTAGFQTSLILISDLVGDIRVWKSRPVYVQPGGYHALAWLALCHASASVVWLRSTAIEIVRRRWNTEYAPVSQEPSPSPTPNGSSCSRWWRGNGRRRTLSPLSFCLTSMIGLTILLTLLAVRPSCASSVSLSLSYPSWSSVGELNHS